MMRKLLPIVLLVIAFGWNEGVFAQNFKLTRAIMVTDTIADEDDPSIRFAASTDDAEQENDEIDALFDDDIDAGWEGEPEDQNILTAGLRFRNITIPQGAVIDSVFLILTSHESKTPEDVANLTIVGDATDHAQTFTEDMLIDARPRTTATVRWIVEEEWGLWTQHRTPDLSPIVQEIVNRDGWESGNALAFIILGEDQGPSEVENAREFESFENIADPEDGGDGQNHPERVPMLEIYYTVNSAKLTRAIMVTDTIADEDDPSIRFAASTDDAEQENDEIDALFDDDIDAGWEGEPEDQNILTAGLRFRNITIPQGAVIDSVFLILTSHESKTPEDVANLTIVGDATDHAQTFTEDMLIDARPRTTATVRWIVDEEWGLWTQHRTPDLSPIVQEIVNRDGWESGNALAFIILGEDQGPSEVENAREFESFENIADPEDGGDGQNHPERVPMLCIYYSSANATTSVRTIFAPQVKELKIFPNPAQNGLVTIELDTDAASVINLFNTNGQLLRTQRFDFGKQVQINTGNLPTGVYYIQARQNDELYIQKLMIER